MMVGEWDYETYLNMEPKFPRRELMLVATARQIREDGTEHHIEHEHNIRKTVT